ncbi:MAG TPA: hypothetical protein DD726_05815, partial [Phycisphaerales bacterium]|nr:hypothetical protein [Phycisphaerales bacterium]
QQNCEWLRILYFSQKPAAAKFFKYLPSMFWIYFLPMMANTVGIIPSQSAVYGNITKFCLPASLVLLLLSVDIKAILHLGRTALAMMGAGVIGIMVGGPVVVLIYKHWLPADAWKAIGALSASWIGGSANMIAVKEATNTPDSVFLPAVIVDTIVPYAWMGILIALSAVQERFDRWNKSDMTLIADLRARTTTVISGGSGKSIGKIFAMIGIGLGGTIASLYISGKMPVVNNLVNTMTWTIIIATVLGLVLSFTPLRGLESAGASKLGFAVLFFVLASIGAKASMSNIAASPVLLLAGVTWVGIHAVFLFIAARFLHSPMSLAASASQAAIGGPASAPVVAGIYNPQLAPVGLLLAVLGNIVGTFLGLCCSYLCGLAGKI